MSDIQKDLLSSSKALLDLDADGALVPHGLGGHGRTCLTWCVDEIERLRADNERLRTQVRRQRAALARIMAPRYHDAWVALEDAKDIARAALKETKDD